MDSKLYRLLAPTADSLYMEINLAFFPVNARYIIYHRKEKFNTFIKKIQLFSSKAQM